ncbi:TMEM175 family protein [Loigolactobacillus zhaoyuanensis]|uniref:TMEM175 family protein n=1 Tax=Loigolactobacillus zhaoyuanensis TaxID=2486017 RepID=A0ABW8UD21_9LACO|nr:TMEM175 family protein [Loigolactobacillus zhaoyuanensis]
MTKSRVEAFTDGVIAILITILVLDLHAPEDVTWIALRQLGEPFFAYVVSFIAIAIYWNNHHHLYQTVKKIDGTVLWVNTALLFWLSILPFATAWVGEHLTAMLPELIYAFVSFMCGLTYNLLDRCLVRVNGANSRVAIVSKHDRKRWLSLAIYAVGCLLTFVWPPAGLGASLMVSVLWFIPNQRVEQEFRVK